MANVMDYIKNYGDKSFCDVPFDEADNVALCGMYYMPFDTVVSSSFDEEPMPFAQASDEIFAARGYKHEPVGLVLLKNISEQMVEMAKQKRYREMKIVAAVRVYEKEPAVQFEAATFLLPDGKIVVLFKGTDDTLIGWKEDFDILTQKGIPSNQLSIDYLENVAKHFDGNIIICGHSKGGFIAQYASLYCSKEVRDRIECVYNNDGPGFWNDSFLSTEEYAQMLPKYKHYVPQSSFIGMMLSHDYDFTVVKSKAVLGPIQHDLATWQFDGRKLVKVDDLTAIGKINDGVLHDLVENLDQEQEKVLDEVMTKVIGGVDQNGLLDVKDNIIPSLKGGAEAWRSIDKETQIKFLKIFAKAPAVIHKNNTMVIKESEKKRQEWLAETIKNIRTIF